VPENGRNVDSVREVIVIGGGPAGYTAALYAARANLEPLVIEGFQWGGQLMITSDVENYPGYPEGVMGPEMMSEFRRQAERFGTDFVTDDVTKVDFSERPFRIWVGTDLYRANAVIIATGASARWIGLESEERLKGRGVSACATCDGAFFRDKHIYVVGGGDSAMEEALFLTRFGIRVTIVHRRDEFRASQIMLDRARANDKIDFITNAVVEEVLGGDFITGLRLRNTETGETWEVDAGALFVAIGHDPNTGLFLDQLDHDDGGYLVTEPRSTQTNIPGVFAVGDVQDRVYRQAITAAGSGCMGALDAERYLAELEGHAASAATAPREEPARA
jgi:thioredoxin reductase (NADPH)